MPCPVTAAKNVANDIKNLVMQKLYPCVAAVQSVAKGDYEIVECRNFGSGDDRLKIRSALLGYLEQWKLTRSTTYTLWITFPNDGSASEEEFESLMWKELSALSSENEAKKDWAEGWSLNPEDKNFTFCIGGHAFFVVGLHANASRKGRQFPYPALIFNVFDQFEDLERAGAYESMVEKNRDRDVRFSGDVNPMVSKWGDRWEAIQFSGRTNDTDWKCPFHFRASM